MKPEDLEPKRPNDEGCTPCQIRWMVDLPSGRWLGSWDREAFDDYAAARIGRYGTEDLGPLPEYAHNFRPRWPGDDGGYSAEQMRAERQRCYELGRAAEREQWAEEIAQLRATVRRYETQVHRTMNEREFGA